jgi:hypothetical protein
MFVYDAGRAIAAERPEALAYIAVKFCERCDLFLVSRESGIAFPYIQERKICDPPSCRFRPSGCLRVKGSGRP